MTVRTLALILATVLMTGCATCITWHTGPHDTPVIDGNAAPDAGR